MLPFNANLQTVRNIELCEIEIVSLHVGVFLAKWNVKQCLFRYLNNFLATKIILTKQASDWWFKLAWLFWYAPGQALMSHPENSSIFSWLCNTIYIFMIMQYSLYLTAYLPGHWSDHRESQTHDFRNRSIITCNDSYAYWVWCDCLKCAVLCYTFGCWEV